MTDYCVIHLNLILHCTSMGIGKKNFKKIEVILKRSEALWWRDMASSWPDVTSQGEAERNHALTSLWPSSARSRREARKECGRCIMGGTDTLPSHWATPGSRHQGMQWRTLDLHCWHFVHLAQHRQEVGLSRIFGNNTIRWWPSMAITDETQKHFRD